MFLSAQPPGHPEICKQSTHECPAKGGLELFVVGKNFLKDTKVYFQEEDADDHILWEVVSEPLKDYLQQVNIIYTEEPIKLRFSTFPFPLSESFDLRDSSVQKPKHFKPCGMQGDDCFWRKAKRRSPLLLLTKHGNW